MGHHDDTAAPPGYGDDGKPGSSVVVTSHDCSLAVRGGPFSPGSSVSVALVVPRKIAISISEPADVTLEGFYSAELMGKRRYQAGQALSAGLAPGAAFNLVTQRETHVFATTGQQVTIELHSKVSDGQDPLRYHLELLVPEHRTCACPPDRPGGVMPSSAAFIELDRAQIQWRIKASLRRKGLLKRDIHLVHPVDVVFPPRPPSAESITKEARAPLKFDTGPSGSESGLALVLRLEVLPNTSQTQGTIPFRLTVRTSDGPPLLLPGDLWPEGQAFCSVALSRHAWTKGIEHDRFDDPEGCQWAGYSVATLSSKGKGPGSMVLENGPPGTVCYRGEYQYEPGYVTAHGCGLAIEWQLNAHVHWNKLAKALQARVPVVLPYA